MSDFLVVISLTFLRLKLSRNLALPPHVLYGTTTHSPWFSSR